LSKPRILLVDDEPSITAALKISLRKEPWEVVTATSAEAGLALLEQQPAAVVLSDERMPGMGGAAFLAEVARRWPTTLRMLLTGQPTLDDAMKECRDAGIWRCFLKPAALADLRMTIAKAIDYHELLCASRRLLAVARREDDAQVVEPVEPAEPAEPTDVRALLQEIREFSARSGAASHQPSEPTPMPAPSAAK